MIRLQLDRARLDTLFPAWMLLGPDLCVRECGPALRRHVPQGLIGQDLARLVPALADVAILAETGAPVQFQLPETGFYLCGSALPHDDGILLALGLLPREMTLDGMSYSIADFAPNDPSVAALLLSTVQAGLLVELRESAAQLAEERRRSVDLLERVSRSAGHMAHEFNNLISIIGLNCDRLARGLEEGGGGHGGDDAPSRLVEIIRQTSRRGAFMTQSLMAIANQQDDSDQVFVLDDLVADHRAFLALLAGTATEFRCELGAPDARVRLSHSGMANCLVNMVAGFADGGSVVLHTRIVRADGQDMVEVALSGAGTNGVRGLVGAGAGAGAGAGPAGGAIAPWFAGSLRTRRDMTERDAVAGFASEARGQLVVERDPAGRLTGLRLRLPLADDGQIGGGATQETPAAAPQLPRVLVVDDEPYALEALAELLEAINYAVVACSNGAEALSALQAGRFDVLLTDVIMPGMSGLELAEEATRRHPDLQVVLMSGYLPESRSPNPEWMFIRKPLDVARLDVMLRSAAAS